MAELKQKQQAKAEAEEAKVQVDQFEESHPPEVPVVDVDNEEPLSPVTPIPANENGN